MARAPSRRAGEIVRVVGTSNSSNEVRLLEYVRVYRLITLIDFNSACYIQVLNRRWRLLFSSPLPLLLASLAFPSGVTAQRRRECPRGVYKSVTIVRARLRSLQLPAGAFQLPAGALSLLTYLPRILARLAKEAHNDLDSQQRWLECLAESQAK